MRKSAQTVIRPDAYYTIAAANGRVLEVADFNTENGASVRLWSYEGQPWQQWQFVEAGDGEYRIRNRFTGKVMDLAMSGVCNGTWVHQWTQTAGAGQRWQIVEAGGGKVKLRNVLADKVMTGGNARGERHPGPDLAGCLWREPALEARPCARAPAEPRRPPPRRRRPRPGRPPPSDPDADREENLRQGRKKNQ